MKVLALTSSYPSAFNPTQATYNSRHFAALDHETELQLIVPVPWVQKRHAVFNTPAEAEGPRRFFPTFWYPPRVRHRAHGDWYYRSVRRLAHSLGRPDLIYAVWLYPDGHGALRLARQWGCPLVVKARGSDLHSFHPSVKDLTSRVLGHADHVITVSDALGKLACELGAAEDRRTTIYNGIDQEQFDLRPRTDSRRRVGLPEKGTIYCCVARLHKVKAIERLIKALAGVRDTSAILALVGGGPEKPFLRRTAENAGVADRVRFAGEISFSEIEWWMNAADAVVLSSRNEGVPNVLIEAISTGTPVVSTAVGGVPERVKVPQQGILTPDGDHAALVAALDKVVATDWDREGLRASVADSSWQANARATAQVFQSLLGKTT